MPRFLVPPKGAAPAGPPEGPAPPKSRLRLADVAWAARVALDRRKLAVAMAGLLAAALVFFLFASVGNVLGSAVWRAILRYLGAAVAYLVLAFTCFVLARLVHFEARTGGVRPGVVETVRLCLGRLWALGFTPGGLALAALVAVGLLGLGAWLGRIAPTFFTFFFLVEFALGCLVVLVGLILTWGLFLYPAILAVDETDELDTVRRYLMLYRAHGLALAGYEAVALVLTWVSALVPAVAAALGLACVRGIAVPTMGEFLQRCAARVPAVLREIVAAWLAAVGGALAWFSARLGQVVAGLGDLVTAPAGVRGEGVMYGLSGVFLGVSLLVIVVASLAYALVFFVTAGTRVYLAYAEPTPGDAAEQRAAA